MNPQYVPASGWVGQELDAVTVPDDPAATVAELGGAGAEDEEVQRFCRAADAGSPLTAAEPEEDAEAGS